jgi:hypothetical protein
VSDNIPWTTDDNIPWAELAAEPNVPWAELAPCDDCRYPSPTPLCEECQKRQQAQDDADYEEYINSLYGIL